MRRDEVEGLYYIAPIQNLRSILLNGILSHKQSKKLKHKSIANPKVQKRRAEVRIPGGGPLHSYANLYFNARNPMMFARKDLHEDLVVLRILPDVLDLQDAVIADRNAATSAVRFEPSPRGLRYVESEYVFARYWNDEDPFVKREKTAIICAEVLVPGRVDRRYIKGVIVSCDSTARKADGILGELHLQLEVIEMPNLFFQREE